MVKQRGLNPKIFLARHLFDQKRLEQVPTRNGYGDGLVEAGRLDPDVVVLSADLTESTRSLPFKQAYPDRFIQLGVSEQAMASIAAGLALAGKVPFISSYACFSPGRNWEQLRTAACLQNANVKIAGAHAGVSVGPDGATHQMTEDLALTRVLPGLTVVVPCDSLETKKATLAAAKTKGPIYVRFAREKSPLFTTRQTPFKIGRAEVFRFGHDLTIFAAGPLLYEALVAAEKLAQDKIEARVINLHTLKPLDVKTIVAAAKETGAVVTVEEAQIVGGLGGAVCETLSACCPTPVERVGLNDHFGQSGEAKTLLEAFGLTAPFIELAARRVLKRKAGDPVAAVPEHFTAAARRLTELQSQIMSEALSRTPRKWGGSKPDSSLKSRRA